jgi:hypothetical protein
VQIFFAGDEIVLQQHVSTTNARQGIEKIPHVETQGLSALMNTFVFCMKNVAGGKNLFPCFIKALPVSFQFCVSWLLEAPFPNGHKGLTVSDAPSGVPSNQLLFIPEYPCD